MVSTLSSNLTPSASPSQLHLSPSSSYLSPLPFSLKPRQLGSVPLTILVLACLKITLTS